jgi:hypothetical protein
MHQVWYWCMVRSHTPGKRKPLGISPGGPGEGEKGRPGSSRRLRASLSLGAGGCYVYRSDANLRQLRLKGGCDELL